MVIFIDDRPIRLMGPKAAKDLQQATDGSFTDFDRILDARLEALKPSWLEGHLLVLNATPITVEKLVHLLNTNKAENLQSVTMITLDKKAAEEKFKSLYKIIKAAGGVVFKDDEMLLMFRRGKWDLPKGKLDSGESSRKAAVREVEEETGVVVAINERIATTWHTYTLNGNRILKRTKWYLMTCVNDSRLVPQADEGIEELSWVSRKKAQLLLTNSFSSIRYVVDAVYQEQPEE